LKEIESLFVLLCEFFLCPPKKILEEGSMNELKWKKTKKNKVGMKFVQTFGQN
jgi:hypothetical protein